MIAQKKTDIVKFVYWIVGILIISSCAQIVSPTGGPKDVKPPKALKYIPDSAATNVKVKNMNIYFNEYIQLKDISQLIISPPVKKQPTVKVKNKILQIQFDGDLKDSTTYCMNFGSAIADITEGNTIDNFRYVFSTGPYIDSLSLKGKVEYAFDHKTEKGILVMLYSAMEDSAPMKKIPDYFAKTKEDGSYKISNIKNGKYRVFALKDANGNYMYDTPDETIGYIDSTINLQKDSSINISLFKEKLKKQFLKKAKAVEYGHIMFVFNKPVEQLNVAPLNFTPKKEWYLPEYSANKDTVNYWLLGVASLDTLKLQISDNKKVLDTVEIKTISKEQPKTTAVKTKGDKFKFSVKTNIDGKSLDLNNNIQMEFNHPIKKHDAEKIVISLDSVEEKQSDFSFGFNDQAVMRKFSITLAQTKSKTVSTWKEASHYGLFIPPGTFKDIFDLPNDTIKLSFKTGELKDYGTMKLKIKIPETDKQYIVQLLDEKENIVKENYLSKGETINYEYLHPQKYHLKLIYDDNKNNKWDTGEYLKKQQPEKVAFSSGTIEVRANWDIEQEWKVEQ